MPDIEISQKQAAPELESGTGTRASTESANASISDNYLNTSRAVIHMSHRIGKFVS